VSFVVEEPIVDSAPPPNTQPATPRTSSGAGAGPRGEEPAAPERRVPQRNTVTTSRATQPPEEEEEADSALSVPTAVLPSLSVARATTTTPPGAGSAVVQTRASAAEVAPSAAPRLRNRERIAQLLADRYPSDLLTRGVGGTTILTVLVAPDGTVERSSVVTSSGNPRLDEAAGEVAARMVFEHPEGTTRQAVWVAVPLTFNPR